MATTKLLLLSVFISAFVLKTSAHYIEVCENHIRYLDCGCDVIHVRRANYGRIDRSVCVSGRDSSQLRNTNCTSSSTLARVRNRCEGKSACSLQASTDVFHDSCPGTHKYLEVSYTCTEPKSRQVCDGHKGNLDCGLGEIRVFSAFYGRRDRATCTLGRPLGQIINTHCCAPTASVLAHARHR
ncbi:L-rhamnose-binding lectin CSL1-like [Engraulis encrasicolus]|uniref:L-rhamnose-binding lectin CSL1-like n=1 Tax=Engraulis encrasicolus TaxID=184585 RepID=UPI002FCF5255